MKNNLLPQITVIPLGPGDPALLTKQAADLLQSGAPVMLRTQRHPVAAWLQEKGIPFRSLDTFYDNAEDFDLLYPEIARTLWAAAEAEPLLYGVSDPLSDLSISALYAEKPDPSAEIRVLPGVGYAAALLAAARECFSPGDLCWMTASSVDAKKLDPDQTLVITEIDGPILAGEVKIALGEYFPDEAEILFLPSLDGNPPEVRKIQLWELDRQRNCSHLSAALIPGLAWSRRERFALKDLDAIMTRLRAPDGCPWDREQTHVSLRPWLVEEAWEAVAAIDEEDPDHLADELGDVLLQIVFHASIGKDFDEFTLTDVISGICRKMIHRHPHVFGDLDLRTARDVSDLWEKIKRTETGSRSVGDSLEDVSAGLPALKYAAKVTKKARQLEGFRRNSREIVGEIRDHAIGLLTAEGKLNEAALSRLLFACSELCQSEGADGEILLHETTDRFKAAFHQAEKEAASLGIQAKRPKNF